MRNSRFFRKEKPGFKKGEFLEKKRRNQRGARIYSSINEACKMAMETGSAEVVVDNKKFLLSDHPQYNGYCFFAFVRMTGMGLTFAQVCEKDSGWIEIMYPYDRYISGINSFVWDNIAAYVTSIEIITESNDSFFKKVEGNIERTMKHYAEFQRKIFG